MTIEEFEAIKLAIKTLQTVQNIKRIDGDGWSVYIVGTIIRIDIKTRNHSGGEVK